MSRLAAILSFAPLATAAALVTPAPTLGQQFIVENKPGAGGTIGFEAGVKSAPDGYTLTLVSSSYTVNPSLYKLRFDPVADITPIIQMSQGPLLLIVHPSLPV